ncbi:MAG: hypothetical protein PHT53_06000 [Candidatus Omnitrophica bacterium]|nr:hypothetical protein [Candidatus Omnitrophota bacterium]
MKRFMYILLFVCLISLNGLAYAASTADVTVRAVVPSTLELSYWIRSAPAGADPYGPGSADATSLDYGTLTFDTTNSIWVASDYFTVFLLPATSGRAYTVQQTNNGVVSTGGNDLNNHLIMTPDYITADTIGGIAQGAMPAGDSLGSASLSYGTNKVIYNGNSGESRIIRSYYGLSTGAAGEPTGALPITTSKPAGTYTGTVTFSVVLK